MVRGNTTPRGNYLYDQLEVDGFLSTFPPVNIFLSHNSPRRIHEREDGVHYGFEGMNSYIKKARPKPVVHGHQHIDREPSVGETVVIGIYGHRLIGIEGFYTSE